MSRRRAATKRTIVPDHRYSSILVAKFINNLMKKGKKSLAEGILYKSFDLIKEQLPNEEAINVFNKALENTRPVLEVKSRRVGGANYQVPIEVRPLRRTALAIRWIIQNANSRPERTMYERLGRELLDAFNKTGLSIKKKEETHRMAEANKAFAHYRW